MPFTEIFNETEVKSNLLLNKCPVARCMHSLKLSNCPHCCGAGYGSYIFDVEQKYLSRLPSLVPLTLFTP